MLKKLSIFLILVVTMIVSSSCKKADIDGTYSYRISRMEADEDYVTLIQQYVSDKGMDVSIGATTLISVGTQSENDEEAVAQFNAIIAQFSESELDAMFESDVTFRLSMICSNTNEEVAQYVYSNF